MKRFCLALDLKDDPKLIAQYVEHHRNVWPEIKASISSSGILEMEIYLVGNRLFMFLETDDVFSFAAKAASDKSNHKVQEWENLMWQYQKALPQARDGEKWVMAERIFILKQQATLMPLLDPSG